ncbi:MAG: hypothetical protein LBI88_04080 [Deltaproteobacteria bacterium]|jgi:hypothetical protein|nr:hypothetical protein [Deltaproteobacteria bacterium]
MILRILEFFGNIFDAMHHAVEHPTPQRRLSTWIFWTFIAALAGIEAKRLGILPPGLAAHTPDNYLEAINLAFTLILILELLSLVFIISCSLSRALIKQFQILALILLRNAFKELTHLQESINIVLDWRPILHIGILGAAALGIFICLGIYQRLPQPTSRMESDMRMRYVLSKKILGLTLLVFFFCVGVEDLWLFYSTGNNTRFFETIYTVLIFADVALVLIAQRYMHNFHATFRNVGFVLATLLIRIALGAPPPWDALIGICAILYALALTWAITRFDPRTIPLRPKKPERP